MVDNIFLQISALLALTVSIAFIMRLLRQPLMIAYIIAGVIAGPLFLNLLRGSGETFETLAQFGVVLLLFLVGLDLNITHVKRIGKTVILVACIQLLFTAGIGYIIVRWLGFSSLSALYLAIALTFSSTIIIVKFLNEKKDVESAYGRHILGLMVIQDIIAIMVMMAITSLNGEQNILRFGSLLVLKGMGLGILIWASARFLLPPLLNRAAKSSEFLFIFTIAWCFGLASLLRAAGFPIEIGAVVAGLTLGASPYQREISSRIRPLRDFFIILFFIILGSEMGVANLQIILIPGIILSLFILFGDPFILYHSFRFLKFTRRNSFLAGITAAHVSEFGFILLFTGMQLGHVAPDALSLFTFVALITIFVSSYAITYNESLYRLTLPIFQIFGPDKHRQKEDIRAPYDVWVFGYHRIGWKICESLQRKKIRYAVVDFNPDTIAKLEHRGIHAFFGDAADVEFLASLPLGDAAMVISTLPAADDQITLLRHLKKQKRPPLFIGNLNHNEHLEALYAAGADYVMMPHLLGGQWVGDVLNKKPWTKQTFSTLKKQQKEEMKMRYTMGTHTVGR